MNKRISLPLKWHGGKHYLADRIIAMMPPHVHYVEPYFGGGAVLFRKPCEGVSEVANDINEELINFFCEVQSERFADLVETLSKIPFSEDYFRTSKQTSIRTADATTRAAFFFVRYRQSRQGLGKDFATLSRNRTRRGMNEQVSSWLSAIEGLPEAHERLKRVVILNHDALDVIRSQDGPNTLFYLDPPYHHDARVVLDAYEHEMTHEQHCALLGVLKGISGKMILSGYHSSLYDAWAKGCGWRLREIEIDNKASGAETKRTMVECLWTNF